MILINQCYNNDLFIQCYFHFFILLFFCPCHLTFFIQLLCLLLHCFCKLAVSVILCYLYCVVPCCSRNSLHELFCRLDPFLMSLRNFGIRKIPQLLFDVYFCEHQKIWTYLKKDLPQSPSSLQRKDHWRSLQNPSSSDASPKKDHVYQPSELAYFDYWLSYSFSI